jgi:microcystin-dependent protein
MTNDILGTIKIFAGNYAPVGYMLCEGQSLSIAGNQQLYSIIGPTYGGDSQTYFQLPDLRVSTHSKNVSPLVNTPTPTVAMRVELTGTRSVAMKYIICVDGISPERP